MARTLKLLVYAPGAAEPAVFRLRGQDALVGRDARCDVVIEHQTVSSRHGLLRASDQGYTFSDLGSRNGSALLAPGGGAPSPLNAAEEVALEPGCELLLGAADAPVRVRVEAERSPFASSGPALTARGAGRTVVAAAPLSDLFVAAPDALVALSAAAMTADSPEALAESALAYLEAALPHAQGRAVQLTGSGFAVSVGDPPPAGLVAQADGGDEVVLFEPEGAAALPQTQSIVTAQIRAAVVAPLRAGGASHGHLMAWSPLGTAALPESALGQLAVASSLLALSAGALAVRAADAAERDALAAENRRLKGAGAKGDEPDPIGSAPAFVEAVQLCRAVAPTDVPVLILGETGTGKEVLARSLHRWSRRSEQPFVPFNCAAIPESLIESELFGHVRGAFTGANSDRQGLFEEADGGVIFLDEIGEMPALMQAKLLRVLQEGEVRRVGASRSIKVDVRVVSATHRDLPALVAAGRFRADLMYRLNAVTVKVPPLRQRRSDVSLLAHFMLARAVAVARRKVPGFAPAALAALMAYDWPGNVRELENEVLRAVALTPEGAAIRAEALSPALGGSGAVAALQLAQAAPDAPRAPSTLKQIVEDVERAAIQSALQRHEGNVSAAARELGLTRPGFYKVMDRLGIQRG